MIGGLVEPVGPVMAKAGGGAKTVGGSEVEGMKEDRLMPKKMHAALIRQAKKLGLTGKRRDAYVYGTMAKQRTHQAGKRHR